MARNTILQGYVDRRVAAAAGGRSFDAALRAPERDDLTALADAVFESSDPVAAMEVYEAAVARQEAELFEEYALAEPFTTADRHLAVAALVALPLLPLVSILAGSPS